MVPEVNHILLTEENRGDFESVFPAVFWNGTNRISLGAYGSEGEILGALSLVLADDQLEIEWLYVIPERRRQGIATGLIEELQRFISSTGEWYPVNARFEVSEQDVSLHRFFLSLPDAEVAYSHERFYVTAEDIRNSPKLHQERTDVVEMQAFFEREESWQKRVLNTLEKTYGYVVEDYESWKEDCVPDLCLYLSMENRLLCGIFVQRAGDQDLELSWLYGQQKRGLFYILGEVVRKAERLFPECSLTFETINEQSKRLAEHLFPSALTSHVYEALWQ